MQTPRDFYITVTTEKIELTGQGGKYTVSHDDLDRLITALENARDSARIARQVSNLPIGKPRLTLVKS